MRTTLVMGALGLALLGAQRAGAVDTCNLHSSLSYPGVAGYPLPGDAVRVGIAFASGPLAPAGTTGTVRRVRFQLACDVGGPLGLPCTADDGVVAYGGDDTITSTCSTTWSGAVEGNELVLTASPALVLGPSLPELCTVEFAVRVLGYSHDATPSAIEQVAGFSVLADDAVCSNGLAAGQGDSGRIELCPACDDGNACTTDGCEAGTCVHTPVAGCTPCATAADCDDADACTLDACSGGVCTVEAVEGCERCTNGVDDDGDGLVDCDDPDCAGDPSCVEPVPPAELCTDCLDNDGDGLVDAEDPDCCWKNMSLTLRRLVLRPGAVDVRRNGLRLKSRVGLQMDPRGNGVRVQVSDRAGQLFCQTIPADRWKGRKRSFRFRDRKGTVANGLRRAKLKFKKDGTAVFRTKGKRMELRTPEGSNVRVTVAFGDGCTSGTAALRTRKKRLIAP